MDVNAYYYGFAFETDKKEFHCHHGEEECELSKYLNCAYSLKR